MQGQGPTANQEADRNRKLCGSFENAAPPDGAKSVSSVFLLFPLPLLSVFFLPHYTPICDFFKLPLSTPSS